MKNIEFPDKMLQLSGEPAKVCFPQCCLLVLITLLMVFAACDKDDNGDDGQPLVFESLTVEHDTIPIGGTTRVTATATGSGLTCYWSVTAGIILGSGKEVVYTTDPCDPPGEHTITCKVEDSMGASETKTVKVFVGI